MSVLVNMQTSTSSKVAGIYLRRRSFLIKMQIFSFRKVAGFYL